MSTLTAPIAEHVQAVADGVNAVGIRVVDSADLIDCQGRGVVDLALADDAHAYAAGVDYRSTTIGSGALLEPLAGDRAVWNVTGYPTRHASDISTATFDYHTDPAHPPAPGTHTHAHSALTSVSANQHHNQAHPFGTGDHSDAPANQADGFVKRNAANDAWEEVLYGTAVNTVAEGDHVHSGSGTHEVLMAEGVTPPDPLLTEDETDWLYTE